MKANKVLGSIHGGFIWHSWWMKCHGSRFMPEILRFSPFNHHSIIALYVMFCISYDLTIDIFFFFFRFGLMQHPKFSSLWVQGLEPFWHCRVTTSSTITVTGNDPYIYIYRVWRRSIEIWRSVSGKHEKCYIVVYDLWSPVEVSLTLRRNALPPPSVSKSKLSK